MQDTVGITNKPDDRLHSASPVPQADQCRKAYAPPQIEDFGRIADLTLSLNNKSPGDYGGGSFAV